MASGALVFIGVISYPLYLWHWPTLSFAAILEAGIPPSAVRVTAVLLSFVLAWLTFVLFERPVRAQRSTAVSIALVAGLAILGAAGLGMYAFHGFPERFAADVRGLSPEPRRNELCPQDFRNRRLFNYCKGTQAVPPDVLFLGDSRAQSIYDGVADLMGTSHAVSLLARGGCPPILGVDLHYRNQHGCMEVWKTFVEYVEQVKPRVVVVLGGGGHLLDPAEAIWEKSGDLATQQQAFAYGLDELVTALGHVSRVIFIRQLPHFATEPSCFLRPIRLPGSTCAPSVPRSTVEADNRSFDDILFALRRKIPQLELVDSVAALCGQNTCAQQLPSGEILYVDQYHLSTAGGRHFARSSGLVELIEHDLRGSPRSVDH